MERNEIIELERRHVWPPYTSSERHEGDDLFVCRSARGMWLKDADGREVIDGNSSWWTCTLGHGHPRLRSALRRQADDLMHVAAGGITHEPVARLARELTALAPGDLNRVHFSDDGSTSVEVAIKAAFQYWQQNGRKERRRFIALSGAYHGDTLGAASVAALEEFAGVFGPLLFETIRPPTLGEAGGWERVFDEVRAALKDYGDEVAAVIVEPLIQGAAGMQMYSPELLSSLREETSAVDTFLIADEVFSGYGRTGRMWACEQADVVPDFLCTAKGFTAGVLPMAATLATDRIYDGFRGGGERALMHGHTFCGNPLGAAVALEVLSIYRDEDIVGNVQRQTPLAADAIAKIGTIAGAENARSLGLVAAVDVGEGGYRGGMGWKVFDAALKHGLFLRPLGDTVYVVPPMNLDDEELTLLFERFEAAVREGLS